MYQTTSLALNLVNCLGAWMDAWTPDWWAGAIAKSLAKRIAALRRSVRFLVCFLVLALVGMRRAFILKLSRACSLSRDNQIGYVRFGSAGAAEATLELFQGWSGWGGVGLALSSPASDLQGGSPLECSGPSVTQGRGHERPGVASTVVWSGLRDRLWCFSSVAPRSQQGLGFLEG